MLGLLLIWLIYGTVARHIISLAEAARRWQPGDEQIEAPPTPRFLRNTEVDILGRRLSQLAETAMMAIRKVEASHDAVLQTNSVLSKRSDALSEDVRARTRELEEANQRLLTELMAERDGLTGLLNRTSFDQVAAEAFAWACQANATLSILLIDVDHFKAYNDYYGHQAGDAALTRVAEVLDIVADEAGCCVARYGGEEFVVALDQSTALSPITVATMLHESLREASIEHQRSPVSRWLTVSIGLASTAGEGKFASVDALVSAADEALYEAKFNGRNQTQTSTPEIRARVKEHRLAVRTLFDAIEEREFWPFLQPQVDARSGELVGVEALARWIQADGRVAAPGEFLVTAVENGLLPQIDDLILERVSEFLLTNPGAVPRLSFNVTGESFDNDNYISCILDLANACSNTQIAIELLETAFIDRPDERFLWQLDRLREAGVEVEIDDFGTGRTSIVGLMAINPGRLKIARELILPLGVQPEQTQVITSVIEIAKALDVDVLAEGIETEEVARILTELGCPMQQGYHHGRPMSLEDFLTYRQAVPLKKAVH